MPVTVIDRIVPKNNGSFPVVGDEHFLGGFRVVADVAARDAITSQRRTIGMWVKTRNDSKMWTLVGGTGNANWQQVAFSSEGDNTWSGDQTFEGGIGFRGLAPIASEKILGAELQDEIVLAVSSTGNDSDSTRPERIVEGDWSAKPFATIQAAIDALPLLGRTAAEYPALVRIVVGAGTFAGFIIRASVCDVQINGTRQTATLASGASSGTATSAGTRTITMTGAGWTVDDLKGRYVRVTAGPGAGQIVVIMKNTTDTLTVATLPTPAFGSGSVFTIEDLATVINTADPARGGAVSVIGCPALVSLEDLKVEAPTGRNSFFASTQAVYLTRCVSIGGVYGILCTGTVICWILDCYASGASSTGFIAQNLSMFALYGNGADACQEGFSAFIGVVDTFASYCYARNCPSNGYYARVVFFSDLYGWIFEGCGYGVVSTDSNGRLVGCEIQNSTNDGLRVTRGSYYITGGLSGSGNGGYGVRASGSNSTIELVGSTPTITGASGEVTVDGATDFTWAALSSAGNYALDAATGARVNRQ
jgi:hypothetical protein